MKLFITCLLVVTGLYFGTAEVGEEVIAALKQGKASDLVKSFDEKVSVRILSQEDVLSRSQSEANIKFFFDKHPVKSFTAVQSSSINDQTRYITGTLETTNGRFKVTVLIKRGKVTQFRIQNAND